MNLPDGIPDDVIPLFEHRGLPRIADELISKGATPSGRSCGNCGGLLYDLDSELVCGECATVVGPDKATRSNSTSNWRSFVEYRGTYTHSNATRCVGGYPHAYDWTTSDDTDGPISDLSPTQFYDG